MVNTSIALNAYPGIRIVGSPITDIGSVSSVTPSAAVSAVIGSIFIPPNTLQSSLLITGDFMISADSSGDNPSFHVLIKPSGGANTEIWKFTGQSDGTSSIEFKENFQRRKFEVWTDKFNAGSTTEISLVGSATIDGTDDTSVWQFYSKALTF